MDEDLANGEGPCTAAANEEAPTTTSGGDEAATDNVTESVTVTHKETIVRRQHSQISESGRTIEEMMGNLKKGVSDRVPEEIKRVPEEIKHSFQKLQGKVFHAIRTINGMNYMYKYRIASDGKLVLEQKLKGIYLTGQRLGETAQQSRQRLIDAGKAVPVRAKRQWRAAVTGDPNKRIRDHMKETPQVKMLDKFSFTLGVLAIVFSEWCLLRKPAIFPIFYAILMTLLMAWRYIDYKAQKYQLFMLDFCYFVNLSVGVQYFFYPDNREWFDVNYVMCSGPVCMAIVVWHNSLVFHSLDKVTSYFLHVMPTMVVHGVRWRTIPSPLDLTDDSSLSILTHVAHYSMAYAAWQIMYLFLTGVVFAGDLKRDPDLITSVRYLAKDKKNPTAKWVKGLLTQKGLIKGGEMDPDSALAQVIFVVTQIIYTFLTSIHVRFLYSNYLGSSIYFVTIFSIGVWNGASYYIEIFSKRYNLKFADDLPGASKKTEKKVASANSGNGESKLDVSGGEPLPGTGMVRTESMSTTESYEGDNDGLDEEDDFVEALESLDLTHPSNLKLYTDLLEPYVVGSASGSTGSESSGEGSETEIALHASAAVAPKKD